MGDIIIKESAPWFLHLLQIQDSAFPTGTFAHSWGMETYIQAEEIRDGDDLKAFCLAYLKETLACGDGIFLKEAYLAAEHDDMDRLVYLDSLYHAFKLTNEMRSGSSMQGRQFLRSVEALMQDDFFHAWAEKVKDKSVWCHYALVYGLYAARYGIPLQAALEAYMYAAILNLVLNAVRAVPLGQKTGIQVMYDLLPAINLAAQESSEARLEDLNSRAIGIDIASMKHEHLHTRLYIS
ncbi:MAG: urease accessory protein UreF [Coriobacteriia bacterium]|nr:urease accessory protein UreF [Coriobacteriia bacterium]